MSIRTCKNQIPASSSDADAERALRHLLGCWALEHQEHVEYDDHTIVVRLPRSGLVLYGLRHLTQFWIDAGRGALQASARQVAEALAAEVLRHRPAA